MAADEQPTTNNALLGNPAAQTAGACPNTVHDNIDCEDHQTQDALLAAAPEAFQAFASRVARAGLRDAPEAFHTYTGILSAVQRAQAAQAATVVDTHVRNALAPLGAHEVTGGPDELNTFSTSNPNEPDAVAEDTPGNPPADPAPTSSTALAQQERGVAG